MLLQVEDEEVSSKDIGVDYPDRVFALTIGPEESQVADEEVRKND